MLAQRRRRWANISPALVQRVAFAGLGYSQGPEAMCNRGNAKLDIAGDPVGFVPGESGCRKTTGALRSAAPRATWTLTSMFVCGYRWRTYLKHVFQAFVYEGLKLFVEKCITLAGLTDESRSFVRRISQCDPKCKWNWNLHLIKALGIGYEITKIC